MITRIILAMVMTAVACTNAVAFDQQQDQYVGLQWTLNLTGQTKIRQSSFSAMLVNQRQGVSDGLVYAFSENVGQSLHYLRPRTSATGFVNVDEPGRLLTIYQTKSSNLDEAADESVSTAAVLFGVIGVSLILYELTEDEVEERVLEVTGN